VSVKGVTLKRFIEFEVGKTYKNRKGTYEVLEIAGDDMRIRWKAGKEVVTTITMQSRILNNMQFELDHPSHVNISSPIARKTSTRRRNWGHVS
jgi:hypothetical protein